MIFIRFLESKLVLITPILVLFSVQISAQKEIYQEIAYNLEEIDIRLLDVDLIELVSTDESTIAITMQDYVENSTFLKIKENNKLITITASVIEPFQHRVKTEKYCYVQPLFPTFKIAIPKGCSITVSYSKGNFKAINFEGNLNLSLDTGDVEINKFKGKLNAELLSGNINVFIVNTNVGVQSNKGNIQANFSTVNWQKTKTSLEGIYGKYINDLKVKAINANIVLNSATTQ